MSETSKIIVNGLFVKLGVVALCLSVSSSTSFLLSFLGGRLANYEGSPSDEAILYSFLYGMVLSQIIALFLPQGNLANLVSIHFAKAFLRSLVVVIPFWLLVALGGSELVGNIFSNLLQNPSWEREWCQISLVLISASFTLFAWHVLYQGQE